MDRSLPFDRGSTWRGNTANTIAPTVQIAGRVYDAADQDREIGAGEGTGTDTKLIALKCLSGPTATVTLTGRALRASTLDNGNAVFTAVHGHKGPSGSRAYLPDPAYASGAVVGHNDLFFGVKEGLAKARASITAANWSVGMELAAATGGNLRMAVRTISDYVLAIAGETATTINVLKDVYVVGTPYRKTL